jgi:hypothetical protein
VVPRPPFRRRVRRAHEQGRAGNRAPSARYCRVRLKTVSENVVRRLRRDAATLTCACATGASRTNGKEPGRVGHDPPYLAW